MDPMTTSRRNFLRFALAAPLAGSALAACGTAGPSTAGGGAAGGAAPSIWIISGQPGEGIRSNTVKRFNEANPDTRFETATFQNDAYKTRIRTAVGADQAPTLIWGWGGGTLRSYVQAGQVDDLTSWLDQNAGVKDRLLPSAFAAGTVDGKVYGMPCETVQPIVLYYNKRVFERVGAQPPQTWGDVMDLVPRFNAQGIAPFSLGGQSRWTNMMWMELLYDRIGGSEVYQAAADGEADSWSNQSAIDALTRVQDLVKANGFINGFSSITADSNADQALLYTDKAAMMLHGSWTYGSMASEGGDFVSGGHLGYMNFPPVDGGKGDPSDTVGNPAQYLSISSKATDQQKEAAKKFLSTAVLSDAEVQEWIDAGAVPIVAGADAKLSGSKDADFLNFVYQVASSTKTFAQSWDQALSPTAAEKLLDNIAQLFQLSISPQQFATNMNQVIGQ